MLTSKPTPQTQNNRYTSFLYFIGEEIRAFGYIVHVLKTIKDKNRIETWNSQFQQALYPEVLKIYS